MMSAVSFVTMVTGLLTVSQQQFPYPLFSDAGTTRWMARQ